MALICCTCINLKKILEYFTVSFNQLNAIKEFGTDCLSRMI